MRFASAQVVLPLALLAAIVSAALTRIAIAYAGRSGMIDAPGARRSHAIATPRGGGIGIVVAVLLFGFAPLLGLDAAATAWTMVALAAVALVGWVDDHRSLSATLRVATHLAAGALATACGFGLTDAASLPLAAAVALAIAGSVNLHNFMDGINGLLATQVLFVFGAIAVAAACASADASLLLAVVVLAATLAFLPFNFPRARIFLGDVGSGALGFLVAAGGGMAVADGALSLPALVALCSAFLVDAGLTLASRVLGGRRWYRAHREHLYQWLVRTGYGHPRVVALYLGWNLVVALPAAVGAEALARRGAAAGAPHSLYSWVVAGLVLAVGSTVWWRVKRHCLVRARQGHGAGYRAG